MGNMVKLKAKDGHELGAYRADPDGKPKGGLVVIQEIFGVNKHMKEVCDGFAKDGYVAIAPALFDRVEPNLELGYTPEDQEKGKSTRAKLEWDGALADARAAADAIKGDAGKVAIIGYCYGGSVVWLAAARDDYDAAVAYYGGNAADFADEKPKCPLIFHVGTEDKGVSADKVEKIKAAQPQVPMYVYEGAGHGFNCDHRGSYHEEAAKLARERTLDFLEENIAKVNA